ncbi:Pyridine nucleotide-disulfide oxidoreductase-like protein 13 [Elsinoe fawcettii]|nr:Pyridine nucleotide-disulfide oxidoreductase-like protein 13 [Elsinoe fawcettii]
MDMLDYDVVIIGAGISGICFAYRLQEAFPLLSYCILESRPELGLRSDSDLYTFGFPWKPWSEPETIAQGAAIVRYMQSTVSDSGIDKHILYNHKVQQMNWSSKASRWTVQVQKGAEELHDFRCRFILLATGYYDYEEPLSASIPGIDQFAGQVIHPQFWPADFDHSGKDVVIVGSGATAITLLPSLAKTAKHVTMLQRSPGYIMSVPSQGSFEKLARSYLPQSLAPRLIRWKWILYPTFFRQFCLWYPSTAKRLIREATATALKGRPLDANFEPRYDPFQQRMCMCPDGDFYECLQNGTASIKTARIQEVTSDTIYLDTGDHLQPDVIVTATGLKLRLGGGIKITVDEKPFEFGQNHAWKGLMMENLPNLVFSFGYFDVSWTLGLDASAQLACRLIKQMLQDHVDYIVPRLSDHDRAIMKPRAFIPLTSTYVEKARSVLPQVCDLPQWRGRASYLWEIFFTIRMGDIRTGLHWVKA